MKKPAPKQKTNGGKKFSVLWNGEWHIVIGKIIENGNVEFQDEHGRVFHACHYKAL